MKKTLQITIRQFLIKLNIYLIHNTYNSTPSKANAHKMVCTMTALLTATNKKPGSSNVHQKAKGYTNCSTYIQWNAAESQKTNKLTCP